MCFLIIWDVRKGNNHGNYEWPLPCPIKLYSLNISLIIEPQYLTDYRNSINIQSLFRFVFELNLGIKKEKEYWRDNNFNLQ